MRKKALRKEKVAGREHSFTVVFEPIEEGGYQVTVPLLPGLLTYGRTLAEARTMARDAILCHLEGLRKAAEPIPDERGARMEKFKIALGA